MKKLFSFLALVALMLVASVQVNATKYLIQVAGGQQWNSVLDDGVTVKIHTFSGTTLKNYAFEPGINLETPGHEFWFAGGDYPMIGGAMTPPVDFKIYGGFDGTSLDLTAGRPRSDKDGNGIVEPWEFTYGTKIVGQSTVSNSLFTFDAKTGIVLDGIEVNGFFKTAAFGTVTFEIVKFANASSGTVKNCVFRNNMATNTGTSGTIKVTGGALSLLGVTSPIVIDGCLFEGNSVNSAFPSGSTTVNYTDVESPALCIVNGTAAHVVKNSLFRGNENKFAGFSSGDPRSYGSAVFNKVANASIYNCVFHNNTNACHTGALFTENASLVEYCTFVNNVSANNSNKGGALCTVTAGVRIRNNLFVNNVRKSGAVLTPASITNSDANIALSAALNNVYTGAVGSNITFGAASTNNIQLSATDVDLDAYFVKSTASAILSTASADLRPIVTGTTPEPFHKGLPVTVAPASSLIDFLAATRGTTASTVGAFENFVALTTFKLTPAINVPAAGTITTSPANTSGLASGTVVHLTVTPNQGYDALFKHWRNGAGMVISTELSFDYTVTASATITAVFKDDITVTPALNVPGAGTISPASSTLLEGTSVTFTAAANPNFSFRCWKNAAGAVISTNAVFNYTANDASVITACFFTEHVTPTTFASVYSVANDGETLLLDGGTYGTEVLFPVPGKTLTLRKDPAALTEPNLTFSFSSFVAHAGGLIFDGLTIARGSVNAGTANFVMAAGMSVQKIHFLNCNVISGRNFISATSTGATTTQVIDDILIDNCTFSVPSDRSGTPYALVNVACHVPSLVIRNSTIYNYTGKSFVQCNAVGARVFNLRFYNNTFVNSNFAGNDASENTIGGFVFRGNDLLTGANATFKNNIFRYDAHVVSGSTDLTFNQAPSVTNVNTGNNVVEENNLKVGFAANTGTATTTIISPLTLGTGVFASDATIPFTNGTTTFYLPSASAFETAGAGGYCIGAPKWIANVPAVFNITIPVDANGNFASGWGTYTNGSTASLSATAHAGYAFDGWYDAAGTTLVSAANPYVFTVTANQTLIAKFAKTYTVTLATPQNGTVSGGAAKHSGENITVTATADQNYIFEGWYDATGTTLISNNNPFTFAVTADITLLAKFDIAMAIKSGSKNYFNFAINDNNLQLLGLNGTEAIQIFSIGGAVEFNGKARGETMTFPLLKGKVYFVSVNSVVFKVVR